MHRRHPGPRPVLATLLIALLAACATPQMRVPQADRAALAREELEQRKFAIRTWLEADRRVQAVAFRLLAAGAELCGERTGPMVGLSLVNEHTFPEEWRAAAHALLGVRGHPQVATVVPGSPAARAGIEAGDIVRRIDGNATGTGEDAPAKATAMLEKALRAHGRALLALSRRGTPLEIAVEPVTGCDFTVAIGDGDDVNAWADGRRIVVEKGMLRFVRSDDELALVLAHEAAHNVLGHVDASRRNALIGGAVGLLLDLAAAAAGVNTQGAFTDTGMRAGRAAYSVAFEQEADYVGLYLMARAGFDIDAAPQLWRRMAAESPEAIALRTTHPTTPERFLGLTRAVEEVRRKMAAGAPLLPERAQQ